MVISDLGCLATTKTLQAQTCISGYDNILGSTVIVAIRDNLFRYADSGNTERFNLNTYFRESLGENTVIYSCHRKV